MTSTKKRRVQSKPKDQLDKLNQTMPLRTAHSRKISNISSRSKGKAAVNTGDPSLDMVFKNIVNRIPTNKVVLQNQKQQSLGDRLENTQKPRNTPIVGGLASLQNGDDSKKQRMQNFSGKSIQFKENDIYFGKQKKIK